MERAERDLLRRLTVDPKIFDGKPIIRGMRLSVGGILGLLAAGETAEELLGEFPRLVPDDIRACLTFAHLLVEAKGREAMQLIAD